jgi:hypothetical protein
MKILFLTLIVFVNVLFSQDSQSIEEYKYFIVLFTIGENWDSTKQTHEQLYFKDHSSNLSELRKAEKIVIGGRYSDTGLIILQAKDEKEAENLVTRDKSIENKIFQAKIFPFNAFYKGCIE